MSAQVRDIRRGVYERHVCIHLALSLVVPRRHELVRLRGGPELGYCRGQSRLILTGIAQHVIGEVETGRVAGDRKRTPRELVTVLIEPVPPDLASEAQGVPSAGP